MEINKQLFEDVLSGKLKGTFVFRDGRIFNSKYLKRSKDTFLGADYYYPYALICNVNDGLLFTNFYTENGFSKILVNSSIDIIDFIPETDMKEKELKITIPEGQEIDWQESAKQEKIVFKKKDTKPRSWEEYCKNFKGQYYYIQDNRDNIATSFTPNGYGLVSAYKNYIPSKELAEAFLAMMQLMSLRQAWIGDWEPDWKDSTNWCIIFRMGVLEVDFFNYTAHPLSFQTEEIAEDFMNCFKDLLEIAKPLI